MIPLFMGLIISSALAWQLINGLLNMMITSFFIGVIGYVVSFMFWHAFRRRKFMVKLMFGL
jgi:multisubunit Na+/H+ antiporter MnhE subunit